MYCCVAGCDVVSKHDVTLFPMPIAAAHRRRWLSAINPSQKLSIDAAVCSKHFPNDHLVFVRGKIRLKPKVVPSLFGDNVNNQLLTNPDRSDKCDSDRCDKENDRSDQSSAYSDSDTEPILKRKTNKTKKVKEVKRKRRSVRNVTKKKPRDYTSSDEETSSVKSDVSAKSDVGVNSDASDKSDVSEKSEGNEDRFDLKSSVENGEKSTRIRTKSDSADSLNPDSSIKDKNVSSEYDILVTPSIEFYCNDDDPPETENVPAKHDIEDILTNYQIKQNNIHSRIDPEDVLQTNIVRNDNMAEIRQRNMQDSILNETVNANNKENNIEKVTSTINSTETVVNDEVSTNKERESSANQKTDNSANQEKVTAVRARKERTRPIFISVTDTHQISSSSEEEEETTRDCVMLLEKVQVDVDPATLMLQDNNHISKADPISLLTSSDESDVIVQEPHIDTVEVSDETDEDEVPLVKLVPKTEVPETKKKSDLIGWSKNYDFFCYDCNFTAKSRKEFNEHKSEHTKVLQVCDICEYTTASKFQFLRHRRKHKDERRFKCHLCSFKAKHHMSLIYHLKRHNIHEAVVEKLNCDNCDVYQTNSSKWLKRHKKHCETEKQFQCENCDYATKRRTDLRRHITKKHARSSGDEYKPPSR